MKFLLGIILTTKSYRCPVNTVFSLCSRSTRYQIDSWLDSSNIPSKKSFERDFEQFPKFISSQTNHCVRHFTPTNDYSKLQWWDRLWFPWNCACQRTLLDYEPFHFFPFCDSLLDPTIISKHTSNCIDSSRVFAHSDDDASRQALKALDGYRLTLTAKTALIRGQIVV